MFVSTGLKGKMEGVNSINTNPYDNGFCDKMSKKKGVVCSKCYSRKGLLWKKHPRMVYSENGEELMRKVPVKDLPVINASFFRFQSHGELLNFNHLVNLMNIAKKNSKTVFGFWTKRKDLLNKYLKENKVPENVVVVYSNPLIDKPINVVPKGFDKVFNVVADKELVNCGLKCVNCLKCYDKFNKNNIIYEGLK